MLTAAHCNRVDFVRLGEWKVLDTNTFNRQECLYYDERTEKQCKDFRSEKCFFFQEVFILLKEHFSETSCSFFHFLDVVGEGGAKKRRIRMLTVSHPLFALTPIR